MVKEDVLRFSTRLDGTVLVFRYVCQGGKIVLKESFGANGNRASIYAHRNSSACLSAQ